MEDHELPARERVGMAFPRHRLRYVLLARNLVNAAVLIVVHAHEVCYAQSDTLLLLLRAVSFLLSK